ncbi:MAG TPA: carboxypeptidase regulatory-like domain-containing protein, partial [Vicinamibacterales bacterium]|nr:carboxypeptidase regulatory-like domain-containing protein [Vicinamibacterales bacterium]
AQQASIAGAVKDASGAAMPGVTVEASSPALIEKIRTTVSDERGLYRIVNLPPGTYTVTFALQGFNQVKRDGIELSGSFVAQIDADMKVGGVTETITVTGASPIVDVQSIRRQTTISSDVLTSIPTARSWAATALLIPGIVTIGGSPADVQVTPQMTVFGGAGGRNNEGRMQVDGLNTGAGLGGSGVSTYVADISNAQEVVTTTSGGLGEVEVGGPSLSIIPKSGGNTISGNAYLSGVGGGMIGSNYTPALQAAGLTTPGKLVKQWDFTYGMGGPIIKDRLWYRVAARDEGQHRTIPNIFPNLNAGDPTQFLYAPDRGHEVRGAESWRLYTMRLTVQATHKDKINVHWDEQHACNGATFTTTEDGCRQQPESGNRIGPLGLGGLSSTTSPEIGAYLDAHPRVRQVTWSETATNRMLFEAGFGAYQAPFGPYESPGNTTRPLVRITEQCSAGCSANGGLPGVTYRSANWSDSWDAQYTWRASVSYVTGAHNLKIGYGGVALVSDLQGFTNDNNLSYTVNNGVPISLTQTLLPFTTSYRTRNASLYVQDQWTHGRMTLQGALRYDRNWSFSPEERINASNWLANPLVFPKTDGVNAYKDLSPRGGVAYDLFGNGKTAVKFNFGKYLEPTSNNNNYILSNPLGRIATTATRSWTDTNGNWVPDCDLRNNAAQNLTAVGGDNCGASNAQTFGTAALTTAAIDPKILTGWGVRSNDWQIGASVQQQVLPRVSIEVGYFRRWLNNFTITDNLAVGPIDFTQYSITAPSDPALPGGGGYVINGLYSVVATGFGQTSNRITLADDIGEQYQKYNGMLFNLSARLGRGVQFQGGINTGKTVQDNCAVRAQVPELTTVAGVSPAVNPGNPYCHADPGFITKATALGSYTLPKVDVLISGTLRSDQGGVLGANWNAPAALVAAALGRPVAGNPATVAVALVKPGDVWGDRVNALDLRFAKILRFGRVRYNVGVDIINATNSDAVLTYNQNYNPTPSTPAQRWLAPSSVLTPRFVKIGAQIDF